MRGKRRITALALAVMTHGAIAAAYPIRPSTLWDLAARADAIVLADVVRIESPDPSEGPWAPSVATLRVVEQWKGAPMSEAALPFDPNVVCPAPPNYVEGEVVLAFLTRDANGRGGDGPEEGGWDTLSRSYGTLYPAHDEWPVFRKLVKEAIEFQAKGASPATRHAWLVEAASHQGTRWHGLYELDSGVDRVHAFYDPVRRSSLPLTQADRARIAAGFVAEPSADSTLPMVVQAVAGVTDPALDAALASAIEARINSADWPWWIADAIVGVLARVGAPPPSRPGRAAGAGADFLNDPIFWSSSAEGKAAYRAAWASAKAARLVPSVEPLRLTPGKVSRVGSDTPP